VWYYAQNEQTFGPVPLGYLQQRVRSGQLTPADMVWREGLAGWVVARDVEELFPRPRPGPVGPPPLPRPSPPPSPPRERKSPPTSDRIPGPPDPPQALYRAADFKDLFTRFMLAYVALMSVALVVSFFPQYQLLNLATFLPRMILYVVLSSIFLYRAWAQLQDGQARTTPGKAVGYRFIPFFNYYWEFVAVKGLAEDIQTYARARGIPIQPIPQGLALTYCILMIVAGVLGIVPILGPLLLIPLAVVLLILLKQIADASAAIAEAKRKAAPSAGPEPSVDGTVKEAVAIVEAVNAGLKVAAKIIDFPEKGHH
jgi:hypothetical protein